MESKVPRKPDGKIDWPKYNQLLIDRFKEKYDISVKKTSNGLLVTFKIKNRCGRYKGVPYGKKLARIQQKARRTR